jgi:hypothetical protein
MNMVKSFLILLLLVSVSSCKWFSSSSLPNLAFTNIKVPAGTPNFKKGFKDGCSTVLYSRGFGLYRARYSYSFHPELIDDPEYYFGRKRGYNFCFGYVAGSSGHFAKGWDGYIYAQGTPFDMGAGNINDTVIGRASGSSKGKTSNVFNTWGDTKGGIGGSLSVLQSNRANSGGVMGGHIFYGQDAKQLNQFMGFKSASEYK